MPNTGSKNGPPNEGGNGRKGGKAKSKQQMLIFGGAAAAVAVFALMKKQSAASSAGTTAIGTPTYNSTGSDQFNQLSDQIAALQGQMANITQGAGSTAPPSASTPPVPVTSPVSGPPVMSSPTGVSSGHPGALPHPVKLPAPPKGSIFHTVTVTHGQTLGGIAKSNRESLSQLLKDNPTYTTNKKYKGGSRIWAGDKVKLR